MMRVSSDKIAKAKEMDLLTFLQLYNPSELIKVSRREYSTKAHSSLKISNGKWMWWSHGFGGRSAVDYLVKVEGLSFMEAVNRVLECEALGAFFDERSLIEKTEKQFVLPRSSPTNERAIFF